MTEPYDLRPNIKDKSGSQGTLFQVKDKGLLNPQQRWPRGYTPERLNEVRRALDTTTIIGGGEGWNPEEMQRLNPPQRVGGRISGTTRYVRYPASEARVHDAIAQSTIPPEHLRGLRTISGEDPFDLNSGGGTEAYYVPSKRSLHIPMHEPDLTPNLASGGTEDRLRKNIVHEIGHHVQTHHERELVTSNIADDIAMKAGGLSEKQRKGGIGLLYRPGVDEARADTYYVEHYKPRGRNKQPDPSRPGRYEENISDPEAREADVPGYTHVRPPHGPQEGNVGPQFEGLFKVSGQGDSGRSLKFSHGINVIGIAPNPVVNGPSSVYKPSAFDQVKREAETKATAARWRDIYGDRSAGDVARNR